jgi:predicted ATPase
MSRIKIKNFGPIKSGLKGDSWIEIKKVTILTGNQGSGKSTVAKLISTISWIEKALIRGDLSWDALQGVGKFEEFCEYQNISKYFHIGTEIKYEGRSIHFNYFRGKANIEEIGNRQYFVPKIMYVPAERNFISSVPNINKIKDLPGTIYTFSDEYRKALKDLKERIQLPINNVFFEYHDQVEKATIGNESYSIDLSQASSGFQSSVPLYLVTKYLAEANKNQRNLFDHSLSNRLTIDQEERIRKEIQEIRNNPNLSENIKRIEIEIISSRFENSHFLNIVEEPEQNLYPTSQKNILFSLLEFNNLVSDNQLVITTHSPYLINYLTLAVKAGLLFNKKGWHNIVLAAIDDIVPMDSAIRPSDLVIYEMNGKDGSIQTLETYNGVPSDENWLNEEMDEFNELYAQLVELENKKY